MSEQPGTPPPGVDTPGGPGQPGDPWQSGPPEQPGKPVQPGAVDPRGRRAKWLGIGALPLSLFQSLYFPIGLAVSIAAIVIGTKARRNAARTHGQAPGASAGIGMGVVALVISILLIGTHLLLRTEIDEYVKCRSTANTIADEQACRDKLARRFEEKFGLKEGSVKPDDLPF